MSETTHRSSGGVSDLTKGSYSSGRKSNNEDVITVAAAADFNYHSFPSLLPYHAPCYRPLDPGSSMIDHR